MNCMSLHPLYEYLQMWTTEISAITLIPNNYAKHKTQSARDKQGEGDNPIHVAFRPHAVEFLDTIRKTFILRIEIVEVLIRSVQFYHRFEEVDRALLDRARKG